MIVKINNFQHRKTVESIISSNYIAPSTGAGEYTDSTSAEK